MHSKENDCRPITHSVAQTIAIESFLLARWTAEVAVQVNSVCVINLEYITACLIHLPTCQFSHASTKMMSIVSPFKGKLWITQLKNNIFFIQRPLLLLIKATKELKKTLRYVSSLISKRTVIISL